ncbi:MAG TPA: GNAT family N-acetyltransferase [Rhizomicrobium sp.]|jgi:putative acetyltransferase|nr:GNAT family N-acetyltransferase [Rhizomicrobium sp.]
MRFEEGNFDDPRVIALLQAHVSRARAETGRGSAHALDSSGLKTPEIRFWTVWRGDQLLGMGALKTLSRDHGEIKSMCTAESARHQGAGHAILTHIVAEAGAMGIARLSLETGAWDYFRPARAFYQHHGFIECAPFADYKPDLNSIFMTRAL